jgi:hypothetical protein
MRPLPSLSCLLQRTPALRVLRPIAAAVPFLLALTMVPAAQGQTAPAPIAASDSARLTVLETRVGQLQQELDEVKALLAEEKARAAATTTPASTAHMQLATESAPANGAPAPTATSSSSAEPALAQPSAPPAASTDGTQATSSAVASTPATPLMLPNGSTINVTLDGYIGYNLNQPVGRVNYLHAYDVLDDVYGINQAAVIYELLPDVSAGRRYGLRVDLQYGQATATLQGSPSNEARPDIWRNLFQAYGRYVAPVGSGITIDVGKWASSLGYEGNYTKDQLNYSRAFFFNFLPFYHAGLRANYAINSKLAVNYWMVNGTNQTEPTNGFKDELFGFVYTPTKNISWTSNYYLGQENPDTIPATNCVIPTQPGLCLAPVNPAPNGKTHIFDNYVSWQATPKLLLVGEGDYFISRVWASAAPGQSSAPSHLDGGAAYAQWQFNPKASLAVRGEYMSDRNGLFSNTSQALKEGTIDYRYSLGDGFTTFIEYRRDWSNRPYFLTGPFDATTGHQDIFTLGMVWFYGGKQGSW